jgi:FMN reductase
VTIRIVGVSGSLTAPSRTTALVDAVVARLGERLAPLAPIESRTIELATLLPDLFAGRSRADLGPGAEAALAAVEAADVVIAGSPAYRAAYTGIFKHFFDFVGQYALVDKPIVLTATGGSDRHALLVEHQMRPLFGFFQALTLPLGIFATEKDFEKIDGGYAELAERIALSIERAAPLLTYQLRSAGRLAEVPAAG